MKGQNKGQDKTRLGQKKGTVLLSTSLAWPAVAGCSRADIFSQLGAISFAQPCRLNFTVPLINAYTHPGTVETGYEVTAY